jgi:hypothetical protein
MRPNFRQRRIPRSIALCFVAMESTSAHIIMRHQRSELFSKTIVRRYSLKSGTQCQVKFVLIPYCDLPKNGRRQAGRLRFRRVYRTGAACNPTPTDQCSLASRPQGSCPYQPRPRTGRFPVSGVPIRDPKGGPALLPVPQSVIGERRP